jgi:hypothetical protein
VRGLLEQLLKRQSPTKKTTEYQYVECQKWDGMEWIGLIWLRIGTSGGFLWIRYWTFRFHKMLGGSWGAAQLAAHQEGLSYLSKYRYSKVFWNVIVPVFWSAMIYHHDHRNLEVEISLSPYRIVNSIAVVSSTVVTGKVCFLVYLASLLSCVRHTAQLH